MRFRCGKPCYIRQSCLFLHDIQNRLCKKLRIFVSKISIIRYPTNVSLNFLCPSETTRNYWFTENGEIEEHRFHELPKVLPADSLLVFNNTRVIVTKPVCIFGRENKGSASSRCTASKAARTARIFLSFQSTGSCSWLCLVGNLKKWKNGVLTQSVNIDGKTVNFCAERGLPHGNAHEVHFSWDDSDVTFATLLDHAGELPIPP